ncbi:hypothetical protein DPMN_133344 [Dreissena polymorpha]|uniref:Uncharacterized protein n=1 Tax=Dreissena polymorpha TaxID=45954 RepID=A0A9D4FV14_DREPO|nr:hypothetical protein DPMN_133344 [Dreissena polymorpha]
MVLALSQTVLESPAGSQLAWETFRNRRGLSMIVLQVPRRSWYRRRLSVSLLARVLGADKASSDEQSWCKGWTAVARQFDEQRAVD